MALKCHHSLFSSHELLKGGITTQTHSVIKGLQASSHTYSYVVTAICSSYSCWRTRWCLSKAKPSELSQPSIPHSQMAVIKHCSFCFAFKRSSDKRFTVFSSHLHLPGPQRADPYLPCYFCQRRHITSNVPVNVLISEFHGYSHCGLSFCCHLKCSSSAC